MRKCVSMILLALAGACAFAQEFSVQETEHYRVISEAGAGQAADVGRRMEAILSLANGVFHFDLARLPAKMDVRIFADATAFTDSLMKTVGEEYQDFVLLAWTEPLRTELDCYPRDEPSFSASLIHQGVIQLARTFVPQIPVWLREGAAAVLEASSWDAESSAYVYRPNLAWLPSLKSMLQGQGSVSLIPVTTLLRYSRDDARAQLEAFYPEAWGLVYFLLWSPDSQHNRVFWDALAGLRPEASMEENFQAVDRAVAWIGADRLEKDFGSFALSLKDAAELLAEGAERYGTGDLAGAEESLTAASRLEPSSSTIQYYLGLVAYARKDYATAEGCYHLALALGAQPGPVNYALGVNAFAAGSYDPAASYLALAKEADPESLGGKVDALLKRMEGQR